MKRADARVDIERVVTRERVDVPCGVRDQAYLQPRAAQHVEHGNDVVVQLEVLVQFPAARDLDRAIVRGGRCSPHAENDPLGEREPDLVVVLEVRVALERGQRRLPSFLVTGRIEREPVSRSRAHVSLRPELGPGTGEREVDVEEDRSQSHTATLWPHIGVWRSLVARSVRVGEVPSSNLGTPIACPTPYAPPPGRRARSGRGRPRSGGPPGVPRQTLSSPAARCSAKRSRCPRAAASGGTAGPTRARTPSRCAGRRPTPTPCRDAGGTTR